MELIKIPYSFSDVRGQKFCEQALTHSSASARNNNVELARVGELFAKAVSLEMLFLSPTPASGADYNAVLNKFVTAHLASVGKKIGLDQLIITGNGLTVVSDNMIAQSLNALFGAVQISGGQTALEKVLLSLEL